MAFAAIHLPLPFKHDASPPAAPRTRSTTGTQRSAPISGPQRIIGASGLGGGTPGPVVVVLASAGEVVCEGDELVVREGPTITPYPGPLPSRAPRIQGAGPRFTPLTSSIRPPTPLTRKIHVTCGKTHGRREEDGAEESVRLCMRGGSNIVISEGRKAGVHGGCKPEECMVEACPSKESSVGMSDVERRGRRARQWGTCVLVCGKSSKCGESGEGEGSEVAVCRRRKGAVHARASRAQVRERAVRGLLTWKQARVEGAVWERGDT
ncbi:hypothetical protein B0H14DRAFT_2607191 [Mycena olivaceomarginata]|nr:hypothetical protein B0H14DRAFT_2607191 [Mycena olivaceomarginata]